MAQHRPGERVTVHCPRPVPLIERASVEISAETKKYRCSLDCLLEPPPPPPPRARLNEKRKKQNETKVRALHCYSVQR